jgi:hypothetical protein
MPLCDDAPRLIDHTISNLLVTCAVRALEMTAAFADHSSAA